MLHLFWAGMCLLGIAWGFGATLFGAEGDLMQALVQSVFNQSISAVELAIKLAAGLAFWMGLLRIAEHAGILTWIGKKLEPYLHHLMPDVPRGHPAYGHIAANMGANMLGLDNAATPAGLKAMQSLQTLNPSQHEATNAQILFIVLNTASITLLPISVMLFRAQMGAADPALVMLPILLVGLLSSGVGLLAVSYFQPISSHAKIWIFGIIGACAALLILLMALSPAPSEASASAGNSNLLSNVGNGLLLLTIAGILTMGLKKKLPVLDEFVEGAKEGLHTAFRITPYLVAMLIAVGLLRASGVMETLVSGMLWLANGAGFSGAGLETLPTGIMKSFSSSASRAMMIELMQHHGVDSLQGFVSAIMQGSSETTFYVLAIYCGSVGVVKIRHAVLCALLADAASVMVALAIGWLWY